MKRKLLCFVLALTMMLSMMPITPFVASAEEPEVTETTYDILVGAVNTILDKITNMIPFERNAFVSLFKDLVKTDEGIAELQERIRDLDRGPDGEPDGILDKQDKYYFGEDLSLRILNALTSRGYTALQAARSLNLLTIWDANDRVELVKSLDSDNPISFFATETEINEFTSKLSSKFPDIDQLFEAEGIAIDEFSFFAFAARQAIGSSIFTDDGEDGLSIKFIDDDRFNEFKTKMSDVLVGDDPIIIKDRTFDIGTINQLFNSFEIVLNNIIDDINENDELDVDIKQILGNYGLYQSAKLPSFRLVPVYGIIDNEQSVYVDVVLEYINYDGTDYGSINDMGLHNLELNISYSDKLSLQNVESGVESIVSDNYDTNSIPNQISYNFSLDGENTFTVDGAPKSVTLLTLEFVGTEIGQAELEFVGDVICNYAGDTTTCNVYNSVIDVRDATVVTEIKNVYVDDTLVENDTITIASNDFTIRGLVKPNDATVTVNNESVEVDEENGTFSKEFTGVTDSQDIIIEAGNDSVIFTVNIDTEGPVITVTDENNNPLKDKSYNTDKTINIDCGDGELVSATLTGTSIETTSIPSGYQVEVSENTEEDFTLVVVAKDALGNETTETVEFTIDKILPVITIVGVEDGQTYGQTSVYFGATEGTAEATLDDFPYANGTLITVSGIHILEISATDDAGNNATAGAIFTIDGEAPSIVGDVTVDKTNVNGDDSVNISFNVSEDNVMAYLNIGSISINNEMTINDKTANFDYDVPSDINAKNVPIKVLLIDEYGNESNLIDTEKTITIDNVSPRVFLLEDSSVEYGLNNYIVSDTLGFSIITDGNEIEWYVDESDPTTVGGVTTHISLEDEETAYNDGDLHTVYYKATDEAGNESATGSYEFKWDNEAPEVPVLNDLEDKTNSNTVELTAKNQDGEEYNLESGSKVLVEKLRNQWILDKISDIFPIVNLREGINKFRTSVKDSAGNVSGYSDEVSIERDTKKPLIKVEKVDEENKVILTANEDVENLSYVLNEGVPVSIDALVADTPSNQIDIAFIKGNNKLVVTGTDLAGNEGQGKLTYVAVEQSITTSLAITDEIDIDEGEFEGEGGTLEVRSVVADAEEGNEFVAHPMDFSGVQVASGSSVVIDVDLGTGLPESTRLWYLNEEDGEWIELYDDDDHGDSKYNSTDEDITVTLNDGTEAGKTVTIEPGHLVAVLRHFSTYGPMADTTAPEITITSPSMSDIIINSDLEDNKLVVTGTLSEECEAVTVNGIAATTGEGFSANIDVTQGNMTITVVAIDAAGNQSTETVDIFVDTVLPTITFDAPEKTRNNPESVTISAIETNNVTTKVYEDSVSEDNLVFSTSAKGDVSFPVDLVEGNNTFVAIATDENGNVSVQASKTIELDTIGSEITIEGVSDGDATAEAVNITVSSIEAGSTWTAVLDAEGDTHDDTFDNEDATPYTVNVVANEAIEYTLIVTATDELGNQSSEEISFTIDDTLPTITVDGINDEVITKEDVTIDVSSTDADALTSALTKNNSPSSFESGDTLTDDGEYSLLIIATNTTSGKTATKTYNFVIDKVAPGINVTGVSNGSTYKSSATPIIAITDNHSEDDNITTSIKLDGKDYVSGTVVTTKATHTLVVTATDEAGNEATETITFTVKASSSHSSSSTSTSTSTSDSATVQTSGGTFELLSEDVVITVANGTFDEKVSISVEVVEDDDIPSLPTETDTTKLKLAGTVYEFDAEGKTFNKPVEVTLSYDKGSDVDATKLGVYVYNETTGQWDYVGGKVDAKNGTVTVTLNHFSKYAVMEFDRTFTDVTTHWAKDDIELMAARHIANGMTDTTFAPQGKITRAQFATLLVRALGLEISENSNSFTDVNVEWFAGYVTTAFDAGLVNGMSTTKFAPEANITREQMAAMIMRAYSYKTNNDYNNIATSTNQRFNDEPNISSWAHHAVLIANDLSIINGMGDDMFAPKADATRAQGIVMIKRLLEATDDL